jgi:hypothetical protein
MRPGRLIVGSGCEGNSGGSEKYDESKVLSTFVQSADIRMTHNETSRAKKDPALIAWHTGNLQRQNLCTANKFSSSRAWGLALTYSSR